MFDCSARFGGVSLNDKLLQGPYLTNRLVGVLKDFIKKLSYVWVTLMQCSSQCTYQNATFFAFFGGLMQTYHKTLKSTK